MLGNRIAALRQQCGLSQKALAERLQVSASTIGMYEQGRREPSADRLVDMAAIFGVSTDYLLTGTPTEPRDDHAMNELLAAAAEHFEGQVMLQQPDGTLRPMSRADLDALISALMG
jgi:transcriptional regulator with XRE-family HTH domain